MKRLLIYLGLLATLLAMPYHAKAEQNWAYYLRGSFNEWAEEPTSDYKFGDTSSSSGNNTWCKTISGSTLLTNRTDNTAYFKVRIKYTGDSSSNYDLGATSGNNTVITLGSSCEISSKNGSNAIQINNVQANHNYRFNFVSYDGRNSGNITVTDEGEIEEGDGPHDYYWVSPQVTNGQKLPYFKMVASRNRSGAYGDGKISTKYFTFTMKDDDFRDYNGNPIDKGTTIQWYIVRDDNEVFYRPATELAYDNTPKTYDDDHTGSGALDSYVNFKNYWGEGYGDYKTTDATRAGSFAFRKGDHKSVTFNMNADKGHIFFNYVNTGYANPSTNSEFYLIGNFRSASETEYISISDETHPLTAKYYTNGVESKTYTAQCDSVVYVTTVNKPGNGWGNLYLDVNPKGNTDWKNVYRPLINLYNGLDGRALVGGLTKAGQGGDNNTGDQSLNPETSDKYTSYEFRFNATTMTYRITFHTSLYLVGPGVSDTEGQQGSWDLTAATDPRIRLTATQEKDHYRNRVYFTQGQPFRFIQNTDESATPNYAYTWYENDNKPKWKTVTTNNEGDYYPGNETQFCNYMQYESDGSESSEKPKEDTDHQSMTFDLPDGWYYVNFYPNAGTPYYTIEHSMELRDFNDVYYGTKETGEVRNVQGRNGYNFLRVWSDHIAWNKPDNIDVFVVSAFGHNAETHETTATLTKLDVDYIPAKTGVILGCKLSKDNLTSGLVYDNAATLAWDKGENVNYYNTLTAELTPYSDPSTSYDRTSKLIPLYEETSLQRFSAETGIGTGDGYANYLFGFYRCKKYQQNYSGHDNDFDLGFWLTTGEGKTYANSAFLHLTKAQAEDLGVGTAYNNIGSASKAFAPAFMLLFDESDDNVITGISDITTAKGNSVASQGWYTLQGVRIPKPTQRGIYIYNGKKVIVND